MLQPALPQTDAAPSPTAGTLTEITPPRRTSLRALLIDFVARTLRERALNPMRAGRQLNIPAAKVPGLMNGETGFSVEKVMALVTHLGYDVHICIEKTPPGSASQVWLELPGED